MFRIRIFVNDEEYCFINFDNYSFGSNCLYRAFRYLAKKSHFAIQHSEYIDKLCSNVDLSDELEAVLNED